MTLFSPELKSKDEEVSGTYHDIQMPNGLVQNLRSKFMALIEMEKFETNKMEEKIKMRKFKSLDNISKKSKNQSVDINLHQSLENLLDSNQPSEPMDITHETSFDFASIQSKFGQPIYPCKKRIGSKHSSKLEYPHDSYNIENSRVQQIKRIFSKKIKNEENKDIKRPTKHINKESQSHSDVVDQKVVKCAILKPMLPGKSIKQSASGVYFYYNNQHQEDVNHKLLVNSEFNASLVYVSDECSKSSDYDSQIPAKNESEGYWKVSRDLVHKIRAKGRSYRFENGKKQELPTTIFPNSTLNTEPFETNVKEVNDLENGHFNNHKGEYIKSPNKVLNTFFATFLPNVSPEKTNVNSINPNIVSQSKSLGMPYFEADHSNDKKRCKILPSANVEPFYPDFSGRSKIADCFMNNPKPCRRIFESPVKNLVEDNNTYYPNHMAKLYNEGRMLNNDENSLNPELLLGSIGNYSENFLYNTSMNDNKVMITESEDDEIDDLQSITEEEYSLMGKQITIHGAYVKLEKTAFLSIGKQTTQRIRNQTRISFDPCEPSTFEYPSEQTMIDLALESEDVRARIEAFNAKAAQAKQEAARLQPSLRSSTLYSSSAAQTRILPVRPKMVPQTAMEIQEGRCSKGLVVQSDDIDTTHDRIVKSTRNVFEATPAPTLSITALMPPHSRSSYLPKSLSDQNCIEQRLLLNPHDAPRKRNNSTDLLQHNNSDEMEITSPNNFHNGPSSYHPDLAILDTEGTSNSNNPQDLYIADAAQNINVVVGSQDDVSGLDTSIDSDKSMSELELTSSSVTTNSLTNECNSIRDDGNIPLATPKIHKTSYNLVINSTCSSSPSSHGLGSKSLPSAKKLPTNDTYSSSPSPSNAISSDSAGHKHNAKSLMPNRATKSYVTSITLKPSTSFEKLGSFTPKNLVMSRSISDAKLSSSTIKTQNESHQGRMLPTNNGIKNGIIKTASYQNVNGTTRVSDRSKLKIQDPVGYIEAFTRTLQNYSAESNKISSKTPKNGNGSVLNRVNGTHSQHSSKLLYSKSTNGYHSPRYNSTTLNNDNHNNNHNSNSYGNSTSDSPSDFSYDDSPTNNVYSQSQTHLKPLEDDALTAKWSSTLQHSDLLF